MKENRITVTLGGNTLNLVGNMVSVGDMAADFTVTGQDMKDVKLSDYAGKVVVLSVFPSIDTPVCAMQTRKFNAEAVSVGEDVVVLTISKDLPFALKRFCAAEGINNVHTLSDFKSNDFGTKYGFLISELQLLTRGVLVVDKLGKIAYMEKVSDVATEPDYVSALEAVKKAH